MGAALQFVCLHAECNVSAIRFTVLPADEPPSCCEDICVATNVELGKSTRILLLCVLPSEMSRAVVTLLNVLWPGASGIDAADIVFTSALECIVFTVCICEQRREARCHSKWSTPARRPPGVCCRLCGQKKTLYSLH